MTNRQSYVLIIGLAILVSSCGGAAGTNPHDMSAAHHEQAAGGEATAADAHAAEYDPSATAMRRCGTGAEVCWTAEVNPTEAHRAEAERHRSAAAAHRAAAAALRDVEARECAGLSDQDRDASPFSHRDDIASVTELVDATGPTTSEIAPGVGPNRPTRAVGATILFRAVRGLTAEWLQRIVNCHLARNAVLGHAVPEMSYCPLVPVGVTARVYSVRGAYAIDVRAESPDHAAEVLRRARLLVTSP